MVYVIAGLLMLNVGLHFLKGRRKVVCASALAVASLLSVGTVWAKSQQANREVVVTQGGGTAPSKLRVEESGDVVTWMSDPQQWHVNECRWMSDRGVFACPRFLAYDDGDPADIAFRRNSDVLADGTRIPIQDTMNLGSIYWQPKVEGAANNGFPECILGRYPFSTFGCRRSSQITGYAGGSPTLTSTPGYLWFGTTKVNQINPTLNMKLSDPGNGETAMWLVVQKDGTETLYRVTVGPPESGGPGYRVLRVAAP